MITGPQIRGARAMLRWSAAETAKRAGLAARTVERLEQTDGYPSSRFETLLELKQVFEAAGIEFIGAPDDAPGVRLRRIVEPGSSRKAP